MKKLLFTLFISLIFFSCNQESQKGAWNSGDKEACRSEGKADLADQVDEMAEFAKKTPDEIIDCMCSMLEENFENYAAADSEMDMNSPAAQKIGMKMMKDCMGVDLDAMMQ